MNPYIMFSIVKIFTCPGWTYVLLTLSWSMETRYFEPLATSSLLHGWNHRIHTPHAKLSLHHTTATYVYTNIMRINTYWAAVKTWVEFVAIALIGESCAFISPRSEQVDSDHIFKDPLRHTLNSIGWSGTTANPQIQSLWALFIDWIR